MKVQAYKLVMSVAAKKAQRILTVSSATKEEIVDHLHVVPDKIVVAYEGVSKELTIKNDKVKLDDKLEEFLQQKYFLYVGNAYPHKNIKLLLEAFSIFLLEYKDVKLLLVGKEDYFYKRLRTYIKQKKLEKSVIVTGFVSDAALVLLYKHAQAVVVPSRMEGFGLPALEAMANKSLALVSDIPSLREICKENVLYFDPTSVQSLRLLLQKVYEMKHKERQFYREKAVQHVKHFSWEKMAQQTLAVYKGGR